MPDEQAVPPKKRPRHLMDPANPRREVVRQSGSGPMHLEPVQKWVLSALAFVTIIHLSGGIVIASLYVGDDRPGADVGLNVIAAAFGVLAVAVFRAIHQKPLLSPWLLVGLLPAAVGLVLVLR
ncbi:hypothetical protein [Nocardioides sp.]|uniref:hypothetical protein n=1 Tax=Nocardioides sp. TaxID=35761 RepID=UPI003783A62C